MYVRNEKLIQILENKNVDSRDIKSNYGQIKKKNRRKRNRGVCQGCILTPSYSIYI